MLVVGACGISITAGYHRLWSHRSYEANIIPQLIFSLFGAASFQNSILIWSSNHRKHHKSTDTDDDPYSSRKGLWFSHIGWMLRDYEASAFLQKNVPDLLRNKIVTHQHKYYFYYSIGMNIAFIALGAYFLNSLVESLLYIGLLRIVVSHHTTFFINSLAHKYGHQRYSSTESARDNTWLALLTYGEGFHSFHHSFQNDYRNGHKWFHFDPTKILIKSMSLFWLAKNLRKTDDVKIYKALSETRLRNLGLQLSGSYAGIEPLVNIFRTERYTLQILSDQLKEIGVLKNTESTDKTSELEKLNKADFKSLSKRLKKINKKPLSMDWWFKLQNQVE